ncbi:MAG TPA: ATP-binding protein [Candidatus Kapabacteria bacterium]|nr:ATP-binding protein [Candidatus Kapabacteria bacterium]
MFKIIKANEPLTVTSLKVLIYGEPGSGKTSLANTAENPLTLDFDKGVHRSDFRKDVLIIESWKQINDNMAELIKAFSNYNTIILDTVDTLLDYMGTWIIEQEPKLARNKLQFYGKLKDEFSLFIGKLKTLGKDVVMIAHVREKEEGDLRIKRPAITGGSYDRVLQIADLVGYLFIKDNKRTIDFNPTDYWIGKNSAKFDTMTIPDFNNNPDFFAKLIKDMKSAINKQTQLQADTINMLEEFSLKIQNLTDLDKINAFLPNLTSLKAGIKKQIWDKIQLRAKELNFEFNKDEKKFYRIENTKMTKSTPEKEPIMNEKPNFDFE